MLTEKFQKNILRLSALFLWYFVVLFFFIVWDLQRAEPLFKQGTLLGDAMIRFPYQWDFELFFAGLFFVWGIFLWQASTNILRDARLAAFTGWAFIVHALTMIIVGIIRNQELAHLVNDSISWFLLGSLLLYFFVGQDNSNWLESGLYSRQFIYFNLYMRMNARILFLVGALLLVGAGCSSSALIRKGVGDYAYSGKTQTGIDDSFATESTEYTGSSHSVDAAVYTGAQPADVDQYLQLLLKDEEGDGEAFSTIALGDARAYYRRDSAQNNSCFFVWPSGKSMIMVRGVGCDTKDALVNAYSKKYPPRSVVNDSILE